MHRQTWIRIWWMCFDTWKLHKTCSELFCTVVFIKPKLKACRPKAFVRPHCLLFCLLRLKSHHLPPVRGKPRQANGRNDKTV